MRIIISSDVDKERQVDQDRRALQRCWLLTAGFKAHLELIKAVKEKPHTGLLIRNCDDGDRDRANYLKPSISPSA
ncbi:hypothetical protein RRG08_014197 [Elysia crispata]|uniref:Uncharacterized protein n=1 Tax=Elysia crispata TaxID=231223 RepID=A0AAE1D9M2_9GAST|nr:hypothetical protein RRG08_014197 [Elysia crispata]